MIEIKLLPARGKITSGSYVGVDNNVIIVDGIDDDTLYGFNIVTNEQDRYYTRECRYLKLFMVDIDDDNKVIGELAYADYNDFRPGDEVDVKQFRYTITHNNAIVGDEVVISCMPLSELHKFRFTYTKDGYEMKDGTKLLTGTISVARNREFIIDTCNGHKLVLKRNSFILKNIKNNKRIYKWKK